jgi:ferrochelatase
MLGVQSLMTTPSHQESNNMDNNSSQIGVLLVNLGTPEAPTAKAVKKYLSQFLHDKRVVDMTRWLWCPILHGVILPIRSPKVAKLYESVWMEGGSPLLVHTQRQAQKLASEMSVPVEVGMTYGTPSIESGLHALKAKGCQQIVVLPLYPQFSHTTTSAVTDAIEKLDKTELPKLTTISNYHDHPMYIESLAQSVSQHWQDNGQSDYLLCSYHGIPQRFADNGDPYPVHCEETTTALASKLNVTDEQLGMSYQSRFGREPWLMPYTDETLKGLPAKGKTRIDIMAPAFASDCLETLEELSEECKDLFVEAGGVEFRYIPCLNDNELHIKMMAQLVQEAIEEK